MFNALGIDFDALTGLLIQILAEADNLIHLGRFAAAFDDDFIQKSKDAVVTPGVGGAFGLAGDHGIYPVALCTALAAGGKVHHVAHHGVVESFFRPHVADRGATCVHADAHLHPGNKRRPLVAFTRPLFAQTGQTLVEKLGRHTSFEGVLFQLHRRVENTNDRIADVFIHIAPLLHEDIRHRAEIFIHESDELLRCEHFREAGEALDIREKGCDLRIDSTELGFLAAVDHLLDERGREVGAEHSCDPALLPPFVGEVDQRS